MGAPGDGTGVVREGTQRMTGGVRLDQAVPQLGHADRSIRPFLSSTLRNQTCPPETMLSVGGLGGNVARSGTEGRIPGAEIPTGTEVLMGEGGSLVDMANTEVGALTPETSVADREPIEGSLMVENMSTEGTSRDNLVGNVFLTMLAASRQVSVKVARTGKTKARVAKGVGLRVSGAGSSKSGMSAANLAANR